MLVTKRKYKKLEREINDLRALYLLHAFRCDDTEQHLAAAESALDYKEAVIEGLQDDIYRMHCHNQAVREILAESP